MDCLTLALISFAAGGGTVALIGHFLTPLLTHRLALARENRAKFNDAATLIRKDAKRDLDRPGHWLDASSDDFDTVIRLTPIWNRRGCEHACEEYRRAKKETLGQDSVGGIVCLDPSRVVAAATALLPYLRPQ